MARIFAPERPALRRTGFRSFSIFLRVGARPVELRALMRPRWWRRLCRNGLVGNGFEEGFVGRLGVGNVDFEKGAFLRLNASGIRRVQRGAWWLLQGQTRRTADDSVTRAPFRKRGR